MNLYKVKRESATMQQNICDENEIFIQKKVHKSIQNNNNKNGVSMYYRV